MSAYVDYNTPERKNYLSELGQGLDHLHSLAAAQVFSYLAQSMHSRDLSFSQVNALFRLYRHGPQRIAELAQGAHLSHCAASRLVSRLAKQGLVQKEANRENRRERLVRLSPAGLDHLRTVQRKTTNAYSKLFQGIPQEAAERFLAALQDILPLLPPPEFTG